MTLRAQAYEKFVDGMKVEAGVKQTAHEILLGHRSNVSPVTAKAIENAVDEHNALLKDQPARVLEPVINPSNEAVDQSIACLGRLLEATDMLVLAMTKMKTHVGEALESVLALKAPQAIKPTEPAKNGRKNGRKR